MDRVLPRRVSHGGSVLASGLAINTQLVADAEARARLLRQMPPGTEVRRTESVYIALFRSPLRLSAEAALGTPLVRYGKLLSACPLEPRELQALEPAIEGVVLVAGGIAAKTPLTDCEPVDISSWLDLSGLTVLPLLAPLARVEAEPRPQIEPTLADLRRSLGIPPLDTKTAKLLEGVKEAKTARPKATKESAIGASVRRLGGLLVRFVSKALRLAKPKSRGLPHQTASKAAAPQAAPAIPKVSVRERLQQFLSRIFWSSQLGNVLGRQYARYLSRLFDMFDRNDFETALRHAVALDAKLLEGGRLPFWTPKPRKSLDIDPKEKSAKSALGMGDELYRMIRERYWRAFARLEAMGDVDKAAFVLAELLNANEEAVAFLEKHKRFSLAAEIAETRKLPPGLAIRLWFLAGERERAIRLARRTGAFADAVLRLEATHKEEADALRLLWASILAEAGQFSAAVDVTWPVISARNLAFAWMDRAIDHGGAESARMLARKLGARPQEFSELRERISQLLRDEDKGSENIIRLFAQELMRSKSHSPEERSVLKAAARRLLPHVHDKDMRGFAQKLIEASRDPAFRADARGGRLVRILPYPQDVVPLATRSRPLEIWRPHADRGAIPLFDAAGLPNGGALVAAGELGALLLSPEGKILARFSSPASHIVMSDNGSRAILLAKRGEAFQLSRLDLRSQRCEPWCNARFDLFAPDFDGLSWFVARGGTLYAIDALASRWEHMWKVDEDAGTIASVRRNANAVSAFFKWKDRFAESWTYDYPSLILRDRCQINQGEGEFTSECVSPSGSFVGWRLYNSYAAYLNINSRWFTLPVQASRNAVAHWLTQEWIVLSSTYNQACAVYVLDYAQQHVRARISFEEPDVKVAARIQGNRLAICDDGGRVMILDLSTGLVLRDYPVS